MKKASLVLCGALAMAAAASARPVSEQTAREAAAGFLSRTALAGAPLQLVYHPIYQHNLQHSTFFAFNAGSKGFVIIAGDDALHPVLAYSSESGFRSAAIPAPVANWLERYEKAAAWAMDRALSADEVTQGEWDALLTGTAAKTTGGSAVQAMVETHWGQDGYYNLDCPWDNAAATNAYTGCTATSMAQIMRFWKHPLTGTGSHSYVPTNNPQYGLLTADFGAAPYNWSQMPAVVATSANPEVARLMYHAGVSVEMHYSAQGSGAQVINFGGQISVSSENALPDYFGYKKSIEGTMRDYLDPGREWIPMLKMELNGSRPFIYVGYGPGGGHAYVADGYDVQNRLHINWGWDGFYDGYFMVDAMEPGPGQSSSYNTDQQALIGIEPEHSALNLDLYAVLNAPAAINYLQPFTVKTRLLNSGTAAFNGDYALRIFDTLGNVVDSIQVTSNQSLAAGVATAELSFSSSGNTRMQPGSYWAGVYYRAQNGRWRQAGAGAGSFANLRTIVVGNVTNAAAQVPVKSRMAIRPVPANNIVQLLSPVDGEVLLLDLQGRMLAREKATAGVEVGLSTAALPAGLYQLELRTAAGTERRKIQVQH